MFDNVGGKIKGVAVIVTWIGIVVSVISGLVMMSDEDLIFIAILVMGLGSLGSWLGSLTLYGFGQLIENTDILVRKNGGNQDAIKAAEEEEAPKEETFFNITCPKCGETVSICHGQESAVCPKCDATLKINFS